ncbi:MAG: chalcone isomerase family protein [Candidatus Rifleibacteriota bacterium]
MKNCLLYCFVLTLVFSLIGSAASARKRAGVQFEDSISIEGTELTLNGLAVRSKRVLFFNYGIYVAGLYLENKSQDGEAILASDTARHLVTHFLHSRVSRKQLTDVWKESFKRHKYQGKKVDQFIAFHPRDLRKGEKMIFTYLPGKGTKVTMKGKVCGTIPGKDFADALFSIYISKNAGLRRIRDGLLGK